MKVIGPDGSIKVGLVGPIGPMGPVGSSVTGPTGPTGPSQVFTTGDKEQSVGSAISGYAQNSGVQVASNPSGYVATLINGVQYDVGDGVLSGDCFFSGDNYSGFRYDTRHIVGWQNSGVLIGGSGGSAGTLWHTGHNYYGQCGDNSTTNRSSPVSVVGGHRFISFDVGYRQSIALKDDGTIWTWGDNYGSLGDNTTDSRSSPVSVVGDHSFILVAMSNFVGAALKEDGSCWCWGYQDGNGAIGDNNGNTNRSSPVSVVGEHSFINVVSSGPAVDPGFLALKSDGTVWAWGENGGGSLGDNSTNDRSSPVSVVGDHSFVRIAGGAVSVGLKVDGTAWAWGGRFSNTIPVGDNTANRRSSPVSVVGDHSFVSVFSSFHRIAGGLKSDGTVWAWGGNFGSGSYTNGSVGDNTAQNRSSPVSVVGDHSFIRTDFGGGCVKVGGSMWSWGENVAGDTDGRLGDNSATARSSPVSVVLGSFPFLPTPRVISSIQANDYLYWNSNFSGFELDSDDRIDFDYIEE